MPVDSLDTNLLSTGRRAKSDVDAPAEAAAPVNRRNQILKALAYTLIFLLALIIFMIVKLPDSVVSNFTMRALNQNTPYNFRADRISFHTFLLPHLSFEKLELEPKFPTGDGGSISIDSMNVYPSILSLIPTGSTPTVRGSFSADAYKGAFSGSFALGQNTDLSLKVDSLDLSKVKPLSQAGLDLKGIITSLALNIVMENQRLSRSDGDIRMSGKNIIFDPASLQLPLPIPVLDLGSADIQARIVKGKLHLDKFQVGAGKDLELKAEGDIQLAEPMNYSRLDLRLRLKPSDKLLQAIPALQGMLTSLAAKRADGYYGMKVSGTLSAMGLPQPDPN